MMKASERIGLKYLYQEACREKFSVSRQCMSCFVFHGGPAVACVTAGQVCTKKLAEKSSVYDDSACLV